MSKRRLSEQQARRIRSKAKTQSIEIDDATLGSQQEGLIISHFGQQLDVENMSDSKIYRCYARSNLPALACGDKVLWRASIQEDVENNDAESMSGVIEALLPRHSVIERPHPHRGLKPIAANLDQLIIVFASEPEPFENLIDRYLIAATHAQLKPILVLNKVDILPTPETYLKKFSIYTDLGYRLLAVSSETGTNMDLLINELKDSTSIFVGQSGVGKSSLLNYILPEADTAIGALSHVKNKGRHTTTTARLYHLPTKGDIIDSPGIREFGLWHLEKQTLAAGFIEFQTYLGQCKFRDCSHENNIKGCAIQQAVVDNEISEQRLNSYFSILRSIDEPLNK